VRVCNRICSIFSGESSSARNAGQSRTCPVRSPVSAVAPLGNVTGQPRNHPARCSWHEPRLAGKGLRVNVEIGEASPGSKWNFEDKCVPKFNLGTRGNLGRRGKFNLETRGMYNSGRRGSTGSKAQGRRDGGGTYRRRFALCPGLSAANRCRRRSGVCDDGISLALAAQTRDAFGWLATVEEWLCRLRRVTVYNVGG
jgi:hypothetical protein